MCQALCKMPLDAQPTFPATLEVRRAVLVLRGRQRLREGRELARAYGCKEGELCSQPRNLTTHLPSCLIFVTAGNDMVPKSKLCKKLYTEQSGFSPPSSPYLPSTVGKHFITLLFILWVLYASTSKSGVTYYM